MVSKRKLAIELILQIAEDGNEHEFREFQEGALKKKVVLDENDKAVPNALIWLKQNNPDFVQVRKGIYMLRQHNLEVDIVGGHPETFDETINRLSYYLLRLKQFDWRKCSDAEWKEARRKLQALEKVNKELDGLLGDGE